MRATAICGMKIRSRRLWYSRGRSPSPAPSPGDGSGDLARMPHHIWPKVRPGSDLHQALSCLCAMASWTCRGGRHTDVPRVEVIWAYVLLGALWIASTTMGTTNRTTFQQQMRNRRPAGGELHGNAKLTVSDVVAIRRLAHDGLSHRALGLMFGVSHVNIGLIVRHRGWRRLQRALRCDATVCLDGGLRGMLRSPPQSTQERALVWVEDIAAEGVALQRCRSPAVGA
jgi:hypothetical protein